MRENDMSGAEDVNQVCFYPCRTNLSTLFALDRKGFFVAIDTMNDQVIGVCRASFLRPDFAFIGSYCVRPEYKGRGIGHKLFQSVMDYVGDRNCCLTTRHSFYKGLGFVLEAKQKIIHYRGQYCPKEMDVSVEEDNSVELKPILSVELMESVIDYDKHINGYNRGQMLRLSLKEDNCQSLVALEDRGGQGCAVVGYGCLRPQNDNQFMLRPVYADNYSVAKRLIVSLMALSENVTESQFTIPAISTNASAIRIAEELGFKDHFQLSILFRNSIIECDYNRVYVHFNGNSMGTV